jgi:hypothetical protein
VHLLAHSYGLLIINARNLTFICLRATLSYDVAHRAVRTSSAVSRSVDLGTRYVTVCVVSLVAGRSGGSEIIIKKVNVYLPSLMMKVPDHLYVLGDTYTCHT